jgi:WD40 repeat protein/serine/threonine protein kinase
MDPMGAALHPARVRRRAREQTVTADANFESDDLSLESLRRIDDITARFEAAWNEGNRPNIGDFLEGVQEPEKSALFCELLRSELEFCKDQSQALEEAAYAARFPQHGKIVRAVFDEPGQGAINPGPVFGKLGNASEFAGSSSERVGIIARAAGYELLRELGRGGMAVVYLARQTKLKRLVALKVIHSGAHDDANLRARFRAEATAVARLQHPHVVQIYEVGERDGELFLALEYVEGGTLAAKLAGRPHAPQDAARLLVVLARAIHAAHQKGIIHRDLKPGNVLLTADGQPKITDFGLAKNLAPELDASAAAKETQSGAILGTPAYMAPEQARGEVRAIGPATDIFALGAILYEMLAGHSPFQAATMLDILKQVCDHDPASLRVGPSRVPRDLETICLTCLQKEPAKRYINALALADDLQRFLNGDSVLVRPPSTLNQLGKFARRHQALVSGVAAVVAVSVLGAVVSAFFALRAGRNAEVAIGNKRVADFQTYRARIAAASAALSNHDVAGVASQLREAPEDLRNWEWHYLQSRLNDSSLVRTVPAGTYARLFHLGNGFQLGAMSNTKFRLTDEDGEQRDLKEIAESWKFCTVGESSSGLWMLQSSASNHYRLLDGAGSVLTEFVDWHDGASRVAAVSPDRSCLAMARNIGKRSYEYAIFDTSSGKKRATLTSRSDPPASMEFSPDGRRIVIAFETGTTPQVWDLAGKLIAQLGGQNGHSSKVLAAVFRPDGARIATTSADGTVRQWDAATALQVEAPYERHTGEVISAAYSPDGRFLATGGADRTIRVWQASGRQDVAVLHGHTGAVTDLMFNADGRRLASASRDRSFGYAHDDSQRIWEISPNAGLPVLRGHTSFVYPVAFSPDGEWLASGSWDKTARLWDAKTGETCAVLPHPDVVWALAFGADSSWLATSCHEENKLRTWDAASARLRKEILLPGIYAEFLAASPKQSRVAVTARPQLTQCRTTVFDEASGNKIYANDDIVLAYSPDDRWMAGSSTDAKTLLLWDAETGQTVERFPIPAGVVRSAAFSPDSHLLASCGSDRIVRVWNIATGHCQELSGHTDDVFSVAFHPGGTRLASAGRDRALWLWDLATGEEVARLGGHTSYVWSLAFSPDGATLASGSGDGTVRLWDTVPLAVRYDARRAAEALRPGAEALVGRLLGEKKDVAEVVKALRADSLLTGASRHAAIRALMRRSALQP